MIRRKKTISRPKAEVAEERKAAQQQLTMQRQTAYEKARERLRVAAVPDSLPCRETEFLEISAHIESSLDEKSGNCIYISGVPGIGKTATIRAIIKQLKERAESGVRGSCFHFRGRV